MKEFKEIITELYKEGSLQEKKLLKKLVYKLKKSDKAKDEIWDYVIRHNIVESEFDLY